MTFLHLSMASIVLWAWRPLDKLNTNIIGCQFQEKSETVIGCEFFGSKFLKCYILV